jgi:hypothetical protein
MRFQGERPERDGNAVVRLHGIRYLDDLRGRWDRHEEASGA